MSRLVVALLAVAGVCLANAASAQERSRLDDVIRAGKLRVCTPGDYKPFSLAKPDGSYEGLDIDLMRSAAAPAAATGTADCSSRRSCSSPSGTR